MNAVETTSDPLGVIDRVVHVLQGAPALQPVGRVARAAGGTIGLEGLTQASKLGDRITVLTDAGPLRTEVIRVAAAEVTVMPEGLAEGVAVGDRAVLTGAARFCPDARWIGRMIDPDGVSLDGMPLLQGPVARPLRTAPPPAAARRAMGARLHTGYAVFDTILPLVRGQRIGLFAGSGVGKSTLLAGLARSVEADVIVIGLVGERGREVRHFVEAVLGPEGMARSVVVAATSDAAPQTRRRCAWAATAVAEYFRDQGKQVLLMLDSVTRFAEAHREMAAASGEPAALRGYPASTGPAIAALCERAGPGLPGAGDITAIYSVLVQGSDMEEPVADMLRGTLDGHIILDRAIAEGGRFPAVDVLRSVSRALPAAASMTENSLIAEARGHLGQYDRAALMVRSGLYVAGSDPAVDAAVAVRPGIEAFLTQTKIPTTTAAFSALRQVLVAVRGGAK
ncbi:flagellum-specific ATP synthase [Ketogulonicigenium robustum]|uniref:Flagellum-specific ATP synthase n=1 Tax=Ketogulonicigenium robustum TaxID=92947 RepID=A0A1W6P1V7_9RHOB|nr:FliI/YscN family ATPase [Ketogulonicigenium robustum]ARO15403.1 flagellum-specific ATP synthase [Ketogulonicigenium robustum]